MKNNIKYFLFLKLFLFCFSISLFVQETDKNYLNDILSLHRISPATDDEMIYAEVNNLLNYYDAFKYSDDLLKNNYEIEISEDGFIVNILNENSNNSKKRFKASIKFKKIYYRTQIPKFDLSTKYYPQSSQYTYELQDVNSCIDFKKLDIRIKEASMNAGYTLSADYIPTVNPILRSKILWDMKIFPVVGVITNNNFFNPPNSHHLNEL